MPEELLPRVWQGPKKPKGSITDIPSAISSVDEVILENSMKKGGGVGVASKINRRDEPIFAPRSLFDRPSPALAKMRRDYKIQKLSKPGARFPGSMGTVSPGGQGSPKAIGPGPIAFPAPTPKAHAMSYNPPIPDLLEWSVQEDNQLLQVDLYTQTLPSDLLTHNCDEII